MGCIDDAEVIEHQESTEMSVPEFVRRGSDCSPLFRFVFSTSRYTWEVCYISMQGSLVNQISPIIVMVLRNPDPRERIISVLTGR